MNFSRLKKMINWENLILAAISLISAVDTFLYIYLRLHKTNLLKLIGIGKMGYVYLFILFSFLAALVFIFRKQVGAAYIVKKTLWTFLPMEMVLFWGYVFHKIGYDRSNFSYTLRPFIGLYLILVGFYFLFRYKKYRKFTDFIKAIFFWPGKKKQDAEKTNVSFWSWKKGWLAFFVLLSVIALNLGFGSYHLSEFAAVDEPLWTYDRIPKFWSNVSDGEFWKTMISDKPGITVAIISGIGMHWVTPIYYQNAHWESESLENYLDVRDLNFSLRFPILLFNALMLVAFYFLLKKLAGNFIALVSVALIGLSPLLIGISTIINPDSLLWTFAPLSLIAYLVYLKDKEDKYLYWTGILLGLAVLTKYVANIMYVFFFGLIFLEYIINRARYEKMTPAEYFKKAFADYLVVIFFSLVTFFALLPAAWIDIGRVLDGTILSKAFVSFWPAFLGIIGLLMVDILVFKNKIIAPLTGFLAKYKSAFIIALSLLFSGLIIMTLADTYGGMKFYDLEAILASPKSSKDFGGFLGLILANFYSLVFGLTPLAFSALLFYGLSNIFPRKKIKETAVWSAYLMLFILFYYLASTIEGVSATVRYQIILYPLAIIISAIGISEFVNIGKIKKYLTSWAALLIILLASIYSLNYIRPFYFSYASSLLPKQNVLNLKDMGDGSYEAAVYLNQLPDAKNLVIWTDKRGVCVFFVGFCRSGFSIQPSEKIDYFVVSSGRESRTSKMTAGKAAGGDVISMALNNIYSDKNYVYKLEIGGRPNNFVKIISFEEALKQ